MSVRAKGSINSDCLFFFWGGGGGGGFVGKFF